MALKLSSGSLYPVVKRELPAEAPARFGLDLEWNPETMKPAIIGVAVGDTAYSVPWDERSSKWLYDALVNATEIVGHNIIQGDFPVLTVDLHHVSFDTLIYFYLTNAHLCKARASKVLPRAHEQEARGGGFMNIWTMASLYTKLPNWKECRGKWCDGPCPTHDIFGYNGLDALAPLLARDGLYRDACFKRVDHLYPLLAKVGHIASQMTQKGIAVDLAYLDQLEASLALDRQKLLAALTAEVNWNSPKQITTFFQSKYKVAPTTTGEEDIESFYEEYGFPEAEALLEIKRGGKGLKSWFDRRYIRDGCLHPNFYPYGATSTGRWASSNPNFQNIPVRRSKDIRRVIRARNGYYLLKADYKQAEMRVMMRLAGYEPPEDLKGWLLATLPLSETDPGVRNLGGVWNALKSLIHAADYGEGLNLVPKQALYKPRYQALISAGALEVCRDWIYEGQVVCFTGVNLATRMFGSATDENRARALELQRLYFSRFPKVREFQKAVSKQVEQAGFSRSAFGFFLQLYGQPVPKLKTALALQGSNPVAYFVNHALVRAEEAGHIPIAQVHDELLFEFLNTMPPIKAAKQVREWMSFEREEMPGLVLPVEVSAGKNWADMEVV